MKQIALLLFDAPRFFSSRQKKLEEPRILQVLGSLLFSFVVQCLAVFFVSFWISVLSWIILSRLSDLWRVAIEVIGVHSRLFNELTELARDLYFQVFAGHQISRRIIIASIIVASVFRLFILSFLCHCGAKVFSRKNINYITTLMIICYSDAPLIFGVIPFFGTALGAFLSALSASYGLAVVYRISVWQGCLVVGLTYTLISLAVLILMITGFLKLYPHLQLLF